MATAAGEREVGHPRQRQDVQPQADQQAAPEPGAAGLVGDQPVGQTRPANASGHQPGGRAAATSTVPRRETAVTVRRMQGR